VGDGTNPQQNTTIADGTSALQDAHQKLKEKTMKTARPITALITLTLVTLAAAPAVAQNPQADGEKLIALCADYCSNFDLIHGNSMFYGGSVDEARQALATIQEVETNVMPKVQPALVVFADNYGTTAMEVSNFFHKAGVTFDDNIGNRFDELYRGVDNVDKSRRASAEGIVARAKNDTGYLDRLSPEIRVKKMKQAKEYLLVARQLDPANADANAMLATVDADIQDLEQAAAVEIDGAKWAGNVSSFAGPGSTSELAAAALEFFRAHPNWTGKPEKQVEVLKVAVRGDWGVAETDIFGRPISWRLPIHLAITDAELKPQGVARVYELSAVTRQGNPGATPKAPPFGAYWVGSSWKMRLKNLG
jgi:hypothetical protein